MDREPVAIVTAIEAVVALLVAFGLDLTAEQTGALVTVVVLVGGWWSRRKVTPTAAPMLEHHTPEV
jgi:hypothetical protein